MTNELIYDASWSPTDLQPGYDSFFPDPDRTLSDTPFEKAKPLAFNIPKNAVGAVDCYIDDLCSICVDINNNAEWCARSVSLAHDMVGHL
jgi:hypothetical protein